MPRRLLPTITAILLVLIAGGIHTRVGTSIEEDTSLWSVYLPMNILDHRSRWIGPGGGTIVDIVINPVTPDVIYAGSWGAGIFKSQDQGGTWREVNKGLGNLYIESLAINPKNPEVIYAGTYGGKVYKSIDAGAEWFLSSDGIQPDAVVYSIAINPDDPNKVYASTRGVAARVSPPWNGALYRSFDAGETWVPELTRVGGMDQEDWVYSIGINPESPNMVFAATHEHGIFRSENYGNSWEEMNRNIDPDGGGRITSRSVVVDPNGENGSYVYTGLWKSPSLYESDDDGFLWFEANQGIDGEHVFQLAVDPINANTIYAATFGRGVMKTTDGADTWKKAGLQQEVGIIVVAITPDYSDVIYSGTYGGGLYRSTTGGSTWHLRQAGLRASNVTAFLVSPANPDRMFASLLGGGVVTSLDGGVSWRGLGSNLPDKDIHDLVLDPVTPSVIFALTSDRGLYKCTLGGDCWVPAGGSLPFSASVSMVYNIDHPFAEWGAFHAEEIKRDEPITANSVDAAFVPLIEMAFSESNPDVVYLGTSGEGIFRSNNRAGSWQPAGLDGETVWSIAIHGSNPDMVYAATGSPGRVMVTIDGGTEWNLEPIPGTVYDIVFAPWDANAIYAGTSVGAYERVEGNWKLIGLQNEVVTVIEPHVQKQGVIYAGLDSGLYASHDGGKTWTTGPEDLEGHTITAISFDPANPDLVYVSTKTHSTYLWVDVQN